jgi:protein subunit release factor B
MANLAPQGEQQEEKGGKKRGLFIFITIIAALLAVLSGYLHNQVNTLKKEAELLKTQKVEAVKETDEYRVQLQMLTAKYDSLMQAHEGLRSELEMERQKVIKLMGDYEALKRSGGTVAGPGNAATSMRKRLEEQQKLEDTKTDVGWGHQIRSYVLDNSRIKDLRTNVEISATQKVLDGDLDAFIEASLKQGL